MTQGPRAVHPPSSAAADPAVSRREAAMEREALAADLASGLTRPGQKEIPSRWLYDAVGFALFEAITLIPEYGLSPADERLLRRHAGAIARFSPARVAVAELGSGSGRKTRWLLRALARRHEIAYHPIDVSSAALEKCRRELAGIPRVRFAPCRLPYLEGLRTVAALRKRGHRLLVLFLGSTIGNFHPREAAAFLGDVARCLGPGDALLLGADFQNDPALLRAAYDDPAGVTAAFNRNLLARMNRELGADFDLRRFDHEARWSELERRVEMHLVSRAAQRVRVPGAGLTVELDAGESIWTESSYKYDAAGIRRLAAAAGFRPAAQWIDAIWPFSENLLIVP